MKAQVYAKRKKNFNNINNEIYIISLKKKEIYIIIYKKLNTRSDRLNSFFCKL